MEGGISMKYMLDVDEQKKQFFAVIDYLKSKGITQKEIAENIGIDSIHISHLRSNWIINIDPDIIEGLNIAYDINPKFITHGASNMFDTAGLKYDNFDMFVDSWDLVEHENKKYLHFTMDENFYDFLIDVFNFKKTSSKTDEDTRMAEAFEKARTSLKEDYSSSERLKEYVLIPCDKALEIAGENISARKNLAEVIDLLDIYPPDNANATDHPMHNNYIKIDIPKNDE